MRSGIFDASSAYPNYDSISRQRDCVNLPWAIIPPRDTPTTCIWRGSFQPTKSRSVIASWAIPLVLQEEYACHYECGDNRYEREHSRIRAPWRTAVPDASVVEHEHGVLRFTRKVVHLRHPACRARVQPVPYQHVRYRCPVCADRRVVAARTP